MKINSTRWKLARIEFVMKRRLFEIFSRFLTLLRQHVSNADHRFYRLQCFISSFLDFFKTFSNVLILLEGFFAVFVLFVHSVTYFFFF